jgi:hypothetical protein
MNTNNVATETVYHILEDGTVVKSRFFKNPGETHANPSLQNKHTKIKFNNITNAEYTVVEENRKTIVKEWEVEKAKVLKARTGWNSVSQKATAAALFAKFCGEGEPLMKEGFFLAMKSFKS